MNVNMIQFQPEIILPNNLEISYPQDVLDWVKDNTAGLKYVAIKKIHGRDDYRQIMRINFQDSPSPNQKPEENPSTICETIFKVLQYHIEGEDRACEFRLTIYRKMEKGSDKPLTKHVKVGSDSSGDRESHTFDPTRNNDGGTLLDRQMEYIDRLHDTLAGMNNFAAQIIGPVIAMNEKLQASNIEMGGNIVRMKEIELLAEKEREVDRMNLLIEQQRIAAGKEKFNTAMKTMNKNGALDKIMGQIANKFLGNGNEQVEIKPPVPKKVKPMMSASRENISPPKINEEEMKREIEKQIEEEMRVSPLYTSCNCLKLSLNQDEEENPDNSIREFIKDTLNEEVYNDLIELLNSENEEGAKANLITLQESISENPDQLANLMIIRNRLTAGQQKIITNILNYSG